MLLTAQRVHSSSSRKTGINAFMFHHGAEESRRIDLSRADLDPVVSEHPGELVQQRIEVAPGGNSVLTFVDVLGPDGASHEEVLSALAMASRVLPANGEWFRKRGIAIRFHAREATSPDRHEEFELLRIALARLLHDPQPLPSQDANPLVVIATESEDLWTFRLDQPSLERVRDLMGREWAPVSITASPQVLADLTSMLEGDLLPQFLSSLTQLPAEDLLRFGGAALQRPNGELLAQWPISLGVGHGYCLRCHKHNTLVISRGSHVCQNCSHQQDNNGLWVGTMA